MDAMERLKRLKEITLDDAIFFSLVVFAIGSCISGHLGKNAEMVAIALCVIRLLRGNIPWGRLYVVKRLVAVLGIFFGTMAISALQTGNYSEAVKFCPVLDWGFEALLIFCVLLCVQSRNQMEILWGVLFLSLLVTDFSMFYALAQGVFRPAGLLNSILPTSTLHTLLIPALAYFSVDAELGKWKRLACQGMLAVAMVGAYIIGTRGIWLAVLLTLPCVFVCAGGWKKALRNMLVCVLCGLVVIMLTPANIRERIAFARLSRDASIAARMAMYDASVQMFIDHPLLGIGTANFAQQWKEHYCPKKKRGWKKHTHPHSIYFQYLVDGGVVGFSGFAVMFGYILVWSWRRRHMRRGGILFGMTFSLLLYGLSDNSLGAHQAIRVYWLTMGMAFTEEFISLAERQTGGACDENPVDRRA